MKFIFIGHLLFSVGLFSQDKISGIILDQTSREPINGANVFLFQSRVGTISDDQGRFVLEVAKSNNDTLIISKIGYEDKKFGIELLLRTGSSIKIFLNRKVLNMSEILIEGERYGDKVYMIRMDPGAIKMSSKEIRSIPYTFFPDINRSLHFLPGVVINNELSSEIYVRGGGPDQNLVLLEGVPVYYPFHVFNIASAFNSDALGEIFFSPGGFSAKYNNRLSSVLDLRSHSPQKPFELKANISMVSADVTVGTSWKKCIEWLCSFRKSYYDLFFKNTNGGVPYKFYDAYAKIAIRPDSNDTVSAMVFAFQDRFRDENIVQNHLNNPEAEPPVITYKTITQHDFSWSNQIFSISWDRHWPTNLNTRLQIYKSMAGNDFARKSQSQFPDKLPPAYESDKGNILSHERQEFANTNNIFADKTMLFSFDWKPRHNFTINAGLTQTNFEAHYEWGHNEKPMTALYDYQDQLRLYFDYAPDIFSFKKDFNLRSGYMDINYHPAPSFQVRTGIVVNQWLNRPDKSIEPRLNFAYDLSSKWRVKAAHGHYTQGIATALEEGAIGFLRLYFPIEDSLSLESADHYIFAFEYNDSQLRKFIFSAYLKNYKNIIKSTGLEPNFLHTPMRSLGIEISAYNRLLGWEYSLAASISKSFRVINNERNDTNWDQRYRFNVYASKDIWKRWRISWSWFLASGTPFSKEQYLAVVRSPNSYTGDVRLDQDYFETIDISIPAGRIRYPWYHRFDLSFARLFQFSKYQIETYFAIRNLYARRNVLYYEESKLVEDKGNNQSHRSYVIHPFKWLPPIPTVGIRFLL